MAVFFCSGRDGGGGIDRDDEWLGYDFLLATIQGIEDAGIVVGAADGYFRTALHFAALGREGRCGRCLGIDHFNGVGCTDVVAIVPVLAATGFDGRRFVDGQNDGVDTLLFLAAIQAVVDVCIVVGAGDINLRSCFQLAALGVEGRYGRGLRVVLGLVVVVRVEVRLRTINVVLQPWEVNVGVAVALLAVDGVVAVYLFLADGVFLSPPQQHPQGPGRVAVAGDHGAAPARELLVVARVHVEVDAREVAFVLVVGFEDGTRVADGAVAGAYLRETARAAPRRAARLAERQVAAAVVDVGVGRHDVERVAVHGVHLATEPTLREGMLLVHHATLVGVRAGVDRRELRNAGVHIPVGAVGFAVGHVVH